MNPNLTPDENYVLNHWALWGSDGYPLQKVSGGRWLVNGIRGLGSFPIVFKTKKAASEKWERYISILRDKAAGRLDPSPGSPAYDATMAEQCGPLSAQ